MVHLKIVPKQDYPHKDISFLKAVHMIQREGLVDEIFEHLLGEFRNLTLKLERYGENSPFWKTSSYKYENSSTKGERPSKAWLHSKVKFYEHEAT